jgi:hypothetical protein
MTPGHAIGALLEESERNILCRDDRSAGMVRLLEIVIAARKELEDLRAHYVTRRPLAEILTGKRASLEEMESAARGIARTVEDLMPGGWGFGLLFCTIGDAGLTSWISNMRQEDMAECMAEVLDRWSKKIPHD